MRTSPQPAASQTAADVDTGRDTTERLSADDQATLREQHFLDAALAYQKARQAAEQARHQAGRCSNCQAACLPQAVYCDQDCQADHERRLQVLARQGRMR